MNPAAPTSPLISPEELAALMSASEPLVVLDTSFDLTDPAAGEQAYRGAHLPGARYVHLDRDLSGPKTGRNGRHPLPDHTAFAATVGRLGITPSSRVVVYDRQGAMYAVRLWWMLRWLGHPAVSVLDGGLGAWQAQGRPVDNTTPQATEQAAYPLPATPVPGMPTIDADGLQRRLGQRVLIDARTPERFRGDVEPIDAQAGHIPGARNRFFKDNLAPDGRFKSADVLRAEFLALMGSHPASEVVNQCGSGVTACHNLLAMAVAGLDGAALYPGSWSEWSADPARPVARG